MRQQDHLNSTYTYTSTPAQHKHMQKRGQESWNTTGPRQRSQDSNNNRPHRSVQILEEALLQWTLGQHTKAKEKEKERTKEKDMAKATKEKDTNKEKPMEATAHTTKEKPKENNNHGTSQKEETKATKKRQKERLAKEKGRIQQPGHMAKDCRTAVYKMSETPQEQNQDVTAQWYDPNNGYDNYWYSNDQSGNYNTHPVQQQQLALPAPPTDNQTPSVQLVATLGHQAASAHKETTTMQAVQQQRGYTEAEIMIDSGAAEHVCPTWFAPDTPLYPLQYGQGPKLRTATDEDISVHGYKRVYMHNTNKQTLVVPFYVCDVTQLNETPTITHSKDSTQHWGNVKASTSCQLHW